MIDDAVAVEDDEFGGGCHHSFRNFFNAVRNMFGFKLPSPASGRSNCVWSQGFLIKYWSSHGFPDFIMAFKMVNNLCMHATIATFLSLPLEIKRS